MNLSFPTNTARSPHSYDPHRSLVWIMLVAACSGMVLSDFSFGQDSKTVAAATGSSAAATSAWVQPGDRVVFIGSGWVERMHHHPWLETMLTLQVPGVTFRNIGWSGDTVFGDARAVFGSRADGYQRLNRDMDYAAPKLAILCYGENEAFGNDQERKAFIDGYRKLIQDLRRHECRTVLIIPRTREAAGPDYPNPSRYNRNLASLAESIRMLAKESQCGLVDLERFAPSERFTTDGVGWSDEGYRQSAREIMKQLGFQSLAIDRLAESNPTATSELQQLIRSKNEWFFHRYRPQNETYLFLFRKHEQGNNAVEVDQMERHVAEGEQAIAAWLAKNSAAPKS
ncbi:MAG: SGNH/GDSL hydrolase family protein [Planctomycetes bacterium]|nr:SGNH/GDSL hydrolase family protein [Planctomycetota bacterium]